MWGKSVRSVLNGHVWGSFDKQKVQVGNSRVALEWK